jgi:hypothetical protein
MLLALRDVEKSELRTFSEIAHDVRRCFHSKHGDHEMIVASCTESKTVRSKPVGRILTRMDEAR